MINANDASATITEAPSKNERWKAYVLLHLILLLYSGAAVCSKFASQQDVFSLPFFLWYGGTVLILGIYAIGWQQVLKRLPLTNAYVNKGVTLVWGFLWGALLFGETISLKMLIGAAVVLVGIVLVVTADGVTSDE